MCFIIYPFSIRKKPIPTIHNGIPPKIASVLITLIKGDRFDKNIINKNKRPKEANVNKIPAKKFLLSFINRKIPHKKEAKIINI
ncbi:hypothetical protein ANS017_27810 [Paraclostridium bifermentans]|nr:hypothetical protein ANS014_33070 [Paraclostridium bifermentans]GKZ08381.1 hypothetical protein ANS015_32640 [Paraclostridium bifermentans]GKZ11397.1 hypothetical protein ANS017_27810 [Paraclostridium bifermentans]